MAAHCWTVAALLVDTPHELACRAISLSGHVSPHTGHAMRCMLALSASSSCFSASSAERGTSRCHVSRGRLVGGVMHQETRVASPHTHSLARAMAANFWRSTQCHRWTLNPASIAHARHEDLQYVSAQDIAAITTWCLDTISTLGIRLHAHQQVIATASVYFQRFYTKNSYAATDPIVVLVTCLYLATKTVEAPVRIRVVCAEASRLMYERGYQDLPNYVPLIAGMEYYLLEELEYDLIVFEVYRSLPALCDACVKACQCPKGASPMELSASTLLQLAWYIANDMYRTSLPLFYPPYTLAIACMYMALGLAPAGTADPTPAATLPHDTMPSSLKPCIVSFLAGFNVSLPVISCIIQDMLSHYELWHALSHPSSGLSLLQDHKALFHCLYRMRENRCRSMAS